MGDDDKAALHETLGSLKTGMKNLCTQVSDVKNDLSAQIYEIKKDVKEDMKEFGDKLDDTRVELTELNGKTVKQGQCTTNVQSIQSSIERLRTDLSKTDDPPAVGFSPVDLTGPIVVPVVTAPKQIWVAKLREHLALIVTLFTLAGILVVGGLKLSRFVVSMDNLVKRQEKASREKLRVIYIDHSKKNDAGTHVNSH